MTSKYSTDISIENELINSRQRIAQLEEDAIRQGTLISEMKLSLEQFDVLSEFVSDYLYTQSVDIDGKSSIISVFGDIEKVTSLSANEISHFKKGFVDLVHPEDLELYTQNFNSVLKNKSVVSEVRFVTKSGIKWIKEHQKPYFCQKEKRITKIFSAVQDISNIRELENSLSLSRMNLYSMMETSDDAICVIDFTGRLVVCNKSFENLYENLLGNRPANGQDLNLIANTSISNIWLQSKSEVLRGETIRNENYVLLNRTHFCFETRYFPLKSKGKVIGYIHYTIDITEKKDAVEDIKQNRLVLKGMLDSFPDTMILLDLNYNIVELNETASHRFEKATGELIGKNIIDLLPPAVYENRVISLDHVLKSKQSVRFESNFKNLNIDVQILPVLNSDNEIIRLAIVEHDITDRVKIEEEIRNKAITLRTLIDAIPESLFLLDKEGVIIDLNATASKRMHKRTNELKGSVLYNNLPDVIAQSRKEYIDFCLKNKTPIQYFDARDEFVFDNRIHPILEDDGNVSGIAVLGIDLTAQKKIEKALHESEMKYRNLVEQLEEGIWVIDKDGITKFVNFAMAKILGYEVSEIIGKNILEFLDKVSERLVRIILATEKKFSRRYESFEFIKKCGTKIYVNIDTSPMFDEEGSFSGGLIGVVDITEKLQSRSKLAYSEQKFHSLFNNMVEGVAVYNIIRNNQSEIINAEIIDYNKSFEKIIQKPAEEIKGTKILDLGAENHKINMVKVLKNVIENKEPYHFEIKFRESFFYISIFAIDKNTISSLFQDVTERRINEIELTAAKEKAEEADKVKANILHNIGHELRTPLNGILGFSQILKDMVSTSEGVEMADYIIQSGKRLERTLNSILFLTELESKAGMLYKEEFGLCDIVSEKIYEYEPQAKSKGIGLIADYKYADIRICSDAYLIREIIGNLLDNAVKYTKQGFARIEVGIQYENGEEIVYIKVEDTGIGIAEDYLPNIFDAFRQGSEGLSRSFEGLGLGLSITNKMVGLLGGNITVSSCLGKGSCFSVFLPKK